MKKLDLHVIIGNVHEKIYMLHAKLCQKNGTSATFSLWKLHSVYYKSSLLHSRFVAKNFTRSVSNIVKNVGKPLKA